MAEKRDRINSRRTSYAWTSVKKKKNNGSGGCGGVGERKSKTLNETNQNNNKTKHQRCYLEGKKTIRFVKEESCHKEERKKYLKTDIVLKRKKRKSLYIRVHFSGLWHF